MSGLDLELLEDDWVKMAKASKQFKRFQDALESVIKELSGRKSLNKIGKLGVKLIRTRTKLGKGVDRTGGTARALKPLKRSYIEQRKRDRAKGKLHRSTSPSKSNLTRTDQMLNSLDFQIRGNSIDIEPSDDRRSDSDLTNQEVADFVESQGRKFLNLSGNEIKQIIQSVRKDLIRLVKTRIEK